jgi:hypothetical protein
MNGLMWRGVGAWFHLHRALQFTGSAALLAGFVIALMRFRTADTLMGNSHRIMGILVFALTCLQARARARNADAANRHREPPPPPKAAAPGLRRASTPAFCRRRCHAHPHARAHAYAHAP